MNNSRRITVRSLIADSTETDEAYKLLAEEMERLGARSAVAAAQQSVERFEQNASPPPRCPSHHR